MHLVLIPRPCPIPNNLFHGPPRRPNLSADEVDRNIVVNTKRQSSRFKIDRQTGLEEMGDWLRAAGVEFCVVDVLNRLHDQEEDSSGDRAFPLWVQSNAATFIGVFREENATAKLFRETPATGKMLKTKVMQAFDQLAERGGCQVCVATHDSVLAVGGPKAIKHSACGDEVCHGSVELCCCRRQE